MAKNETKAFGLLSTSKTTKEKAKAYAPSIRRDLLNSFIIELERKKDKINDKLFDLQEFTLDSDLNAQQKRMSMEECKTQFNEILALEYELKLIEMELKAKREIFEEYFGIIKEEE